jgi:hypothetical protein
VDAQISVPSDVDGLLQQLSRCQSDDVIQLHISGRCDLAGHQRIQQGVESARAKVRALVHATDSLAIEPTQDDIDALSADGYVGEVLRQLRDEQSATDSARARDALIILAQLLDKHRGSREQTA